jgi:hypothetical protein
MSLNNESHYYPKYQVGPTTSNNSQSEFTDTNYPHVQGNVDRSGNLSSTNTETDTVTQQHVSGTTFFTDGKGHMRIDIADQQVGPNAQSTEDPGLNMNIMGKYNKKARDEIEMHTQKEGKYVAEKALTLSSKEKIVFAAPSISYSGPLDVIAPTAPTARQRPSTVS